MEYKEGTDSTYNKLQLKDKRAINAYFQKEMQRLSKIVKDGNIKAD
jgi:hypothetical protein